MEKSAFIAIIGRANVGKSSLLNKVLGQKISIVSDKPQTTRTGIMGVLNCGEDQVVFIDTPGFHKPKNVLGENMVKAVNEGMKDVDAAVLVVEANPKFQFDKENLPAAETSLIENIKAQKLKSILVINKIDLLADKSALLEMIEAYNNYHKFDSVILTSAKSGSGVDEIKAEVLKYTKPSPHYFGDDDVTNQPDKVMVAEMIREKILRSLNYEVPHGIAVDVEKFFERDTKDGEPIVEVEAVIYCEKDSHKGIIIGKNGAMLKHIGVKARQDIERFYGIKASVKLWVKVKEDWRNRKDLIHSFGLD